MEQTNMAPPVKTELPPMPQTGSHPFLIIALLLTFPPLAFIRMWKEPPYHRWFAYFLGITGIISVVLPIAFMIYITPKLVTLYHDFGRTYDVPQNNTTSLIAIASGIIQLIIGVWVFYKTRGKQALGKFTLIVTVILVSMGLVVAFISYQNIALSALLPVYNLL